MSRIFITKRELHDEDWKTQCAKGYENIPEGAEVVFDGEISNCYGTYAKVYYKNRLYYVKADDITPKVEVKTKDEKYKEAHVFLEERQRAMTQHRNAYSKEEISANGIAIEAIEKGIGNLPTCSFNEQIKVHQYKCAICCNLVNFEDHYCRICGQKINWG